MSDRRVMAALGAGSLLLSLPYALMGPNLLLDDWFTVWWRIRDGVLWTGGHDQLWARPGSWLLYLVQYGLIGPHPLALYALQAVVNAATVALLYLAAVPFVGRARAGAVAIVWALLANHSTTDRWFATLPALVSVTLLLLGIVLLERAVAARRPPVAAVAVMVMSALCYEVSLAPGAFALLAVPWLLDRRPSLRWLIAAELPLVTAGAWMFVHSQHRTGEFDGWFDFGSMLNAHMGAGLLRPAGAGAVLGLVGAVAVFVALARTAFPTLRRLPADATRLVLAGTVVIALGTLAFVRYPISPIALGDRANAVSSIGSAVVWVGIGVLISRAPRPIVVGATAVFVVALLVGHVQRDVDYARAGHDSVRILAALRATQAGRPPGTVVVGPRPVFHHGVVGLIGTLDPAVKADSGDPRRTARVAESERDFLAAPAALRLDVRKVLRPNRRAGS